ncbi:hypothetical protein RYX36_029092, partial [Vicia faba]
PLSERTKMVCLGASDVKKLLKVVQMESVKARICSEYCSDYDQAVKIAKMLDNFAAVIMLDDVVFLQPEQ